jgi:uncharacterized damage-inducible protein DinB
VQTLRSGFRTTHHVLSLALADLDDASARRRTRGSDGPSIAWTVGHLLDHRIKVMQLLGVDRESPYTARYGRTAATSGEEYPDIAALRKQWADVHAELEAAFDNAPPDLLDRPLPDGGAHGETGIRDTLAFLAWHEGYHTGVIGAARKALGLAGPAELVAAAATSNVG